MARREALLQRPLAAATVYSPQRFEVTEADCQWWLERFSKDELVVMAEAIETTLSEP